MGNCQQQVNEFKQFNLNHNNEFNWNSSLVNNFESDRYGKVYINKLVDFESQFVVKIERFTNEEAFGESIQVNINIYKNRIDLPNKLKIESVFQQGDFQKMQIQLYKAYDTKTNQPFLFQIQTFDSYDSNQFKTALNSIFVINETKKLKLENVLELQDYYIIQQEKIHLILLYEYCDYTLYDIINARKYLQLPWKAQEFITIISDLSNTMHNLVKKGICHRELRPENIFYNTINNKFKIGYFDHSKKIVLKKTPIYYQDSKDVLNEYSNKNLSSSLVGVPMYIGDEVIQQHLQSPDNNIKKYNPFMLDVYALGITFNQMEQLSLEPIKTLRVENLIQQMIHNMIQPYQNQRCNFQQIYETTQQYEPEYSDEYQECRSFLEQQYLEKPDFIKVISIESMAKVYQNILQLKDAITLYQTLVDFFTINEDQENKALTYEVIGDIYRSIKNKDKYQFYYTEASQTYLQAAKEYQFYKNYELAIQKYQQAITIYKKLNLNNEVVIIQQDLALIYKSICQFQLSLEFYQKVYEIYTEEKNTSINMAKLLNNIGNNYGILGQFDKAEESYKQCLDLVVEQNYSKNLLCLCYQNLGELNREKKFYHQAMEFQNKAEEIQLQLTGENSFQMAYIKENQGNIFYDNQDYQKALKLFQKALVLKKSKLESDDSQVAITLNNIGKVFMQLDDYQNSQKILEEALEINRNQLGENHIEFANTLANLAFLYQHQGQDQKFLQFLQIAMCIIDQTCGPTYWKFKKYFKQLKASGAEYDTEMSIQQAQEQLMKIFQDNQENVQQQHSKKSSIQHQKESQLQNSIIYNSQNQNLQKSNLDQTYKSNIIQKSQIKDSSVSNLKQSIF